MQIRIKTIPTLSAASFGAFTATLLIGLSLLSHIISTEKSMRSNYGQAIANLAAKQAVDASFNHDLVRLQVILQDVMENPHTQLATIHDVENNLLVQAGDTRTKLSKESFSSPINLSDTIAGYVSVTIGPMQSNPQSLTILIISLSLLFFCTSIWSLFQSKAIVWQESENLTHPDSSHDLDQQALHLDNGITVVEEPEEEVFSVIHIKNLNVLKQQLNGQSFRDTIARLEKIISDVLVLYSGHNFQLIDNYYVLKFYVHSDRGEALFNASCSAFLILDLAGILDKIPLDLAALVSANAKDIEPENLPFSGLIVEATAGSESLINRRIEFMELGKNDGRQVLSGFRQPFKNLLENQRKQLSQIL